MQTQKYDYDDGSLATYINRTGIECAKCGESISYTDEVFLLTVVVPIITPEGVIYEPLSSEDGDFMYAPQVFDLMCWEEIEEDIRERVQDVPPIIELRAILECSICESGIMQQEALALVSFGEIHCSQRCPNNTATNTFQLYDSDPKHVCLSCLRIIDEEIVTMWEGEVQQIDECRQGTHYRCWRYGCVGSSNCQAKYMQR